MPILAFRGEMPSSRGFLPLPEPRNYSLGPLSCQRGPWPEPTRSLAHQACLRRRPSLDFTRHRAHRPSRETRFPIRTGMDARGGVKGQNPSRSNPWETLSPTPVFRLRLFSCAPRRLRVARRLGPRRTDSCGLHFRLLQRRLEGHPLLLEGHDQGRPAGQWDERRLRYRHSGGC